MAKSYDRPDRDVILIDVKEVARLLSINVLQVKRAADAGQIPPPVSIAGQFRWVRQSLVDFFPSPKPSVPMPPMPGLKTELPAEDIPPQVLLIDPSAALTLREIDCEPRPCVYFLIQGATVVYVGSSKSLGTRIDQHRKGSTNTPRKEFDRVLFMDVSEEEMLTIEARWINLLSPPLNVTHVIRPNQVAGADGFGG